MFFLITFVIICELRGTLELKTQNSSASIMALVTGERSPGAVIGNRAEERGVSTATTATTNDIR